MELVGNGNSNLPQIIYDHYDGDKKIVEKATTIYKVIDKNSEASLVELKPITGRKHQLRKQLYALGQPIFGDIKYKLSNSSKGLNKNLMLHSYQIQFMIKDKNCDIYHAAHFISSVRT